MQCCENNLLWVVKNPFIKCRIRETGHSIAEHLWDRLLHGVFDFYNPAFDAICHFNRFFKQEKFLVETDHSKYFEYLRCVNLFVYVANNRDYFRTYLFKIIITFGWHSYTRERVNYVLLVPNYLNYLVSRWINRKKFLLLWLPYFYGGCQLNVGWCLNVDSLFILKVFKCILNVVFKLYSLLHWFLAKNAIDEQFICALK